MFLDKDCIQRYKQEGDRIKLQKSKRIRAVIFTEM